MLKKKRRCAPKNHPCQVTLRAGSPQEWRPRVRHTKTTAMRGKRACVTYSLAPPRRPYCRCWIVERCLSWRRKRTPRPTLLATIRPPAAGRPAEGHGRESLWTDSGTGHSQPPVSRFWHWSLSTIFASLSISRSRADETAQVLAENDDSDEGGGLNRSV